MSGTNCKTLKGNVHKCANESQYFDQAFSVLKMRLLARLRVPFYTNVHLAGIIVVMKFAIFTFVVA